MPGTRGRHGDTVRGAAADIHRTLAVLGHHPRVLVGHSWGGKAMLALAELEGLGSPAQGGWLAAPPSAELLPAGAAALTALDALLQLAETWLTRASSSRTDS
jgi:pimeloyl-ACP methyl ester carboxylesterase